MADSGSYDDDEVHRRMATALDALGTAPGQTVHGNQNLQSVRIQLTMHMANQTMMMKQAPDDEPTPIWRGPPQRTH